MTLLLDLLYLLALVVLWPWLVYRRLTRGAGSLAVSQRLGQVPSRPVSAHCVWLHGVSLGEINATRTLVSEIRARNREIAIVVSSTTQTGLERARALYPDLIVFRFPLDFSFVIRRVLDRVRPSVIVLMELEVWPNLIEVADAEGIPVTIANGRVSEDKSMRRFQKPIIARLARRMFSRLTWIGAQDLTYAERFIRLGARPEAVEVTGSVKYDGADVADEVAGQRELARQMNIHPQRPLWVCGSTGPGEELLLLEIYAMLRREFPDLQLALIPRKPERFDEVAALIAARGYGCRRRSAANAHAAGGADSQGAGLANVVLGRSSEMGSADVAGERIATVFLGDTLGELRKFYALATVVFVGRTLVGLGGSDVMEVAGLGKPLLVGPHVENFAEPTRLLVEAGGCVQVGGADDLARGVAELLRDAPRRRQAGAAARDAIVQRRGASARTVDRLFKIMETA